MVVPSPSLSSRHKLKIWLVQSLDGKVHARKRVLTVKSWSTVKDLKDILQSLLHLPAASQVRSFVADMYISCDVFSLRRMRRKVCQGGDLVPAIVPCLPRASVHILSILPGPAQFITLVYQGMRHAFAGLLIWLLWCALSVR